MQYIYNGPEDSEIYLILTHGQISNVTTDWFNSFSKKIAEKGIRVIRFNFPFMSKPIEQNGPLATDSDEILLSCWRNVISEHQLLGKKIFIGGRSHGARMASLVAKEMNVDGLLLISFPFIGKHHTAPDRIRHLERISTPTLIIQGSEDQFGTNKMVEGYKLSNFIQFHWLDNQPHKLLDLSDSTVNSVEYFLNSCIMENENT